MKLTSAQTQLKLFLSLFDGDRPMRLSEISEVSGESPQLVKYHLPKMIRDGIIVPLDIDGEKYYSVQFVFLNTVLFEKLSEKIIPVVKTIAENVSYEHTKEDKESVIRNSLLCLIMAISRGINGQDE